MEFLALFYDKLVLHLEVIEANWPQKRPQRPLRSASCKRLSSTKSGFFDSYKSVFVLISDINHIQLKVVELKRGSEISRLRISSN